MKGSDILYSGYDIKLTIMIPQQQRFPLLELHWILVNSGRGTVIFFISVHMGEVTRPPDFS